MSEWRVHVAELYRRHAASVYRRALALLGNEAEARETLHDLFVSLLERPGQFAGRSAMSTYLYAAVTNACLNRLRNQRNRARLLDAQPVEALPSQLAADQLVLIRRALEQLPSPLAEVAVYYFVDELSHQEIAELLGCSRRHVGDLLARLSAWGRTQEDTCSVK